MKTTLLPKTIALIAAVTATAAFSQNIVEPAPPGPAATTIYRQVMPDGRVVYSDKAEKGGKVEHTITIEPPIKGNLWTTEPGPRPAIPPQTEHTAIKQGASIPASGKKKTAGEATSDVIRAEMLLEDAKQRRETGVAPLPGERASKGSGGTQTNEAYEARQKSLAKDVSDADALLKKALADREGLR